MKIPVIRDDEGNWAIRCWGNGDEVQFSQEELADMMPLGGEVVEMEVVPSGLVAGLEAKAENEKRLRVEYQARVYDALGLLDQIENRNIARGEGLTVDQLCVAIQRLAPKVQGT
jgi:hypothetical protein